MLHMVPLEVYKTILEHILAYQLAAHTRTTGFFFQYRIRAPFMHSDTRSHQASQTEPGKGNAAHATAGKRRQSRRRPHAAVAESLALSLRAEDRS